MLVEAEGILSDVSIIIIAKFSSLSISSFFSLFVSFRGRRFLRFVAFLLPLVHVSLWHVFIPCPFLREVLKDEQAMGVLSLVCHMRFVMSLGSCRGHGVWLMSCLVRIMFCFA